ncbi:hypothetical protein [Bacillus massilinigeriensis]|uniref:hypothetical protein n=1 Tax=Bacillus massilionigeriensis TaxID=1805475 RepID=UPI00096B0CAE|nr:hypothetical protein [Bacillus massilionigeriensis]
MIFLYHATKLSNYYKIIRDGVVKRGIGGEIYFTTQEAHSVNWVDLTGNSNAEDIVCFRINAFKLDQSKIEDGIDHDPNFFKGITVKTYSEDIPIELFDLDYVMKYESKYKESRKEKQKTSKKHKGN